MMEKKYFNGHDEINRFFCFHSKNYQTLLIILNLIQIQQPAAAAAVVFISFFFDDKSHEPDTRQNTFCINQPKLCLMNKERKQTRVQFGFENLIFKIASAVFLFLCLCVIPLKVFG